MFTAAMLPQLAKMQGRHSFFVLATNHIRSMDPAAIRKGRFAMRKGYGFIADSEVARMVEEDSVYELYPAKSSAVLAKLLRRKPVKELIDIKSQLKHLFLVPPDKKQLLAFFKSRKPYLSEAVVKDHIRDCEEFDDDFRSR